MHTYTLEVQICIIAYVRPSLLVYHGRGKERKRHVTIGKVGNKSQRRDITYIERDSYTKERNGRNTREEE